jgi:hypothetical protein
VLDGGIMNWCLAALIGRLWLLLSDSRAAGSVDSLVPLLVLLIYFATNWSCANRIARKLFDITQWICDRGHIALAARASPARLIDPLPRCWYYAKQ